MHASRLESAGWFLLAAYALVGFATLTSSHGWGDDWAQYVLHARNIVTGVPYGDTGYVFNPDAPYVGPPEYPPGLPLLLAPVIALFGVDIVALKAVCFLCVVVMLPVAYAALARAYGRRPAFAAVLLFALHEQVWILREQIGSEAPYLLFSMLALWHASRDRAGAGEGRALAAGAFAGLLTYASIACRSIGIALVPALLLDAWTRRKPLSWHAGFLASLIVPILVQRSLLVSPPTYSGELVLPGMRLVLGNLESYWSVTRWLVPMPLGFLSDVALAALIAAAIYGAWRVYVVCATPGISLRNRLGCVPLPCWYLGAYVSALALASISAGPRYLFPILPIVLALAARGVARLTMRTWGAQPAMAMLLAVYYVYLFATAHRPRDDELATCGPCRELYAFVQTHTPPGSVIAFAKPRALALFGDRPAWIWNPDYEARVFRAKLRERASFFVIAAPGTALRERYPPYVDDRFAAGIGATVFRNAMFTVVDVREPAPR